MNLLQINTSIRGEQSHSSHLATLLTEKLQAAYPDSELIKRDLAQSAPPLLDGVALGALFTPAEQRDAEQQALAERFDALIDEIQQADRIVLGVPMYNFGIPAQLKAWFDAIARADLTFRYTESGPEGLLRGKKVYLTLTYGGQHSDTPLDTMTPYLQTMLGFLGMTDLTFIHAEGLARSGDVAELALRQAELEIAALEI
ncbi:FMN-dependent NADH-azoreductase [Methylomonas sp. 2B]|uniref:FMN-dependent NADH-azoreductase n=1 Tax=Methylomonas sp. 2B TaxID=3367743 RepID=UPI0037CAB433